MDDHALPLDVSQALAEFVEAAGKALGDDLVAAILFGSAAEGRLRATSDVNLMLVLRTFEPARVDALREPLRLAHATIRLEAMLIREGELADAAEAFAVKFADIAVRHRVLAGRDVLAGLKPSLEATRQRLRQILLNFVLRTRERYAITSLREEQLAVAVADCAAPLRAAAEIMLQLEDRPAASPKAALETVAAELGGGKWDDALANLSKAREERYLPPGVGAPTMVALLELGEALRARAGRIGA
jgi:predicted nucleotidyltransferase